MERRMWYTFLLASVLLSLAACQSPLVQSLFEEQEWSENYALADGVRCTSPEMIDGDVNTAGITVFPEGVHGRTVQGVYPNAEAEVTLPEKRNIRKIVIRSEKLDSFKVMACVGHEGDWETIQEFDNNKEKEIVIRTSVFTDKILVRARPESTPTGGVRTFRMSAPEIQEIEIYGFKSAASQAPEEKQEPDTDQTKEFFF
jgi:hypothetical protein